MQRSSARKASISYSRIHPYNVPIEGQVCGSGRIRHRDFAMGVGKMDRQALSFGPPRRQERLPDEEPGGSVTRLQCGSTDRAPLSILFALYFVLRGLVFCTSCCVLNRIALTKLQSPEGVMNEREAEIRRIAFAIWESEGQPEGRDKEHWAQAEAEVSKREESEAAGSAGPPPDIDIRAKKEKK